MPKLLSTGQYQHFLNDRLGFHPASNTIIECLVGFCHPDKNLDFQFRKLFREQLRIDPLICDLRKFFLVEFLKKWTAHPSVEYDTRAGLLHHIHNLHFDRKYKLEWYSTQLILAQNKRWKSERALQLLIDDEIDNMLIEQTSIISATSSDMSFYRKQCVFNLEHITLSRITGYDKLKTLGWYSKTNPLGVTKDHKYSVHDGYHNKIDPFYLRHPANCEFLTLRENSSKNYRSSVSIDELKIHIKNFNIH